MMWLGLMLVMTVTVGLMVVLIGGVSQSFDPEPVATSCIRCSASLRTSQVLGLCKPCLLGLCGSCWAADPTCPNCGARMPVVSP